MKDDIKKLLENNPIARERRFRNEEIVKFLQEKWRAEFRPYSLTILLAFCEDYESAQRNWRDITRNNKHLRGKDYKDKQVVEETWQVNNGFTPGYYNDVKQRKLY